MQKNNSIKLVAIFACSFIFLITEHIFAVGDGMSTQVREISQTVSDFIGEERQGESFDIASLTNKVQTKSDQLGLNLDFQLDQEINSSQGFELSGACKATGEKICNVSINKTSAGFYSNGAYLDPYNDACIIDYEDRSLRVAETIESVFVYDGNKIKEGTAQEFCDGGPCVYKVRTIPSLFQRVSGPCGYYALFNLGKLYYGKTQAGEQLNRDEFEELFAQWKKYTQNQSALGVSSLDRLIENRVAGPDLCKDNVFVMLCSMSKKCPFYDADFAFFGINDKAAGNNSLDKRINDFHVNGTPQYFLMGTGPEIHSIPGITLEWGHCTCLDDHWFAIKIEWSGLAGKSPVIITVADSSGPQDNRFAALIHWCNRKFAYKDVNYEYQDAGVVSLEENIKA